MSIHLNLGVDRGNGNTKVATLDGNRIIELCECSMVSFGDMTKLEKVMEGTGNSFQKEWQDYTIGYEGMNYFFGNLAVDYGVSPLSGIGDKKRYEGLHTRLAIAVYATMIAKRMYIGHPFNEITADIVMGVPYETYLTQAETIPEKLIGTYLYTYHKREMRLNISSVKVFMEGAGAAVYYGLDKNGIIGLVDTGRLTTNYFVGKNGKPDMAQCGSFDIGIESALQLANEQVNNSFGRFLTTTEQDDLLFASIGKKPLPNLYAGGEPIPGEFLYNTIRTSLDAIGENRNILLASKWNRDKEIASSFKKVLHVGGGSYYLGEKLKKLIKHTEILPDAEKLNARGYALLAQKISERKLKRA